MKEKRGVRAALYPVGFVSFPGPPQSGNLLHRGGFPRPHPERLVANSGVSEVSGDAWVSPGHARTLKVGFS